MTLPRGSQGKEMEKKPCYPDCDDPFCERVHPVEPDNMKNLVEEIANLIASVWLELPQLATLDEVEAKEREKAKEAITLTLQAVADGELKLPGEATRIDLWDGAEVGGLTIPSGGHTLIALSPFPRDPSGTGIPVERPEGTGKEEE